jgi:hypothetical protein
LIERRCIEDTFDLRVQWRASSCERGPCNGCCLPGVCPADATMAIRRSTVAPLSLSWLVPLVLLCSFSALSCSTIKTFDSFQLLLYCYHLLLLLYTISFSAFLPACLLNTHGNKCFLI